ncbi:hypothetical protein XarjCFBP7653_08280 [Xanthomonas arboricola]|nr:hypothetical protein XarjCFBP7653_08280 [Xanthomonas arboricola]
MLHENVGSAHEGASVGSYRIVYRGGRYFSSLLGEYSSNPIVGPLAEQMKEKYRESILEKAAEARLKSDGDE